MSICMTCGDDAECYSCGSCSICECYCSEAITPNGKQHHAMNCECEPGDCDICDNRSKYVGNNRDDVP